MTNEEAQQLVQFELIDLISIRKRREELRVKHAENLLLNAELMNRPCMVLQPTLLQDDGKWKAVRGDLIGVGDTPDAAMDDFDSVYSQG